MPETLFAFDSSRPLHPDEHRHRSRAVMLGIAAAVTVGGLATALFLGTVGYEVRRQSMHNARLKGILVQTPTVYQVTEGLREKAPLVLVIQTREELQGAVVRWGGDKSGEILEKALEWPQLRIYAAGDMMYFIYFDGSDIMRDYVFVSASVRSL